MLQILFSCGNFAFEMTIYIFGWLKKIDIPVAYKNAIK